MKKLTHPITLAAVGIIVVALIIVGTALYTNHHSDTKVTVTKTTKSSTKTVKSSHAAQAPNANSSTPQSKTQAADQAASADATQPVTNACKLLSLGVAQQILGSNTQTTAAKSTSAIPTSNTTVTSCAYNGANGTVQLTIRTPNGQLGTSENDTAFGSSKPTGAVAVQGYGQSAYWNPSTHELSILGSNNWYVITRNTGSQADAETVAQLLAQGF